MNELYHYGVKGQKWGVRSVTKLGSKTVSECNSYVNRKMDDYLRG